MREVEKMGAKEAWDYDGKTREQESWDSMKMLATVMLVGFGVFVLLVIGLIVWLSS